MLIKTSKSRCIWKSKANLGESPLWVSKFNSIFFVDIKKKKILIINIRSKKKRLLSLDKEIGFISHIKKDIFALGLKSEIRIVDLKKEKTIISVYVELKKKGNRINDGKVDPAGRLWFGTIDNSEKKSSGSLYCLDNYLKLHKVDNKYFISNGPTFLDKNNFYHTDSAKRKIYKITVNNKLKIVKKSVYIKFRKEDGYPDGMTTDINNNLWVCHYGYNRISVFNLKGLKIHEIMLPVKNITSCTFGGINNKDIFITTALKGLSKYERNKYPLSGGLFKIKTNIRGKKSISFKVNKKFY